MKHHQLLAALALEDELDKARCKLCDLVRAEAFGLGHSNWIQRQCAACFAVSAERSALVRHQGRPPDVSELDSMWRDSLLFRILAVEQRINEMIPLHSPDIPPELHHSHRSARIDVASILDKEEAEVENADILEDGRRKSAKPGGHGDAVGVQVLPQTLQEKEFLVDRRTADDTALSSDGERVRKEDGVLSAPLKEASFTDTTTTTGVHPVDVAAAAKQALQALRSGDRRAVLDVLMSSEEIIKVMEDALYAQQKEAESVKRDSVDNGKEAPQLTAIDKLRAELKQAEEAVVFAPTQKERTKALHLAFELRRGLAELSVLERRDKRVNAMQRYRDRIVVPRPRRAKASVAVRGEADGDISVDQQLNVKNGSPTGLVDTPPTSQPSNGVVTSQSVIEEYDPRCGLPFLS